MKFKKALELMIMKLTVKCCWSQSASQPALKQKLANINIWNNGVKTGGSRYKRRFSYLINIKTTLNINHKVCQVYIMPHVENVQPAGVILTSLAFEMSPVEFWKIPKKYLSFLII